jgi:hypothetical protein
MQYTFVNYGVVIVYVIACFSLFWHFAAWLSAKFIQNDGASE